MILEKFICGPVDTNAYLFGDDKLCAIDPAYDSKDLILAVLEKTGLTLDKILLTHSHWDHIADVKALQEATNAPVYVNKLDAIYLEKPGSDGLPSILPIQGVKTDCFLEDGATVTVGNLVFQIIHTPGHSPGGVCFYQKEQKLLFSGDTLFQGTIGNLGFPTSDPDAMWESLKKLEKLPLDTRVLPGHGPDTFLEDERWIGRAKEKFKY